MALGMCGIQGTIQKKLIIEARNSYLLIGRDRPENFDLYYQYPYKPGIASSTDYDAIGSSYQKLDRLVAPQAEKTTADRFLGSVAGLRVLDLACGAGCWKTRLVAHSLAYFAGGEISSKMIETLREETADSDHIEYFVTGCSRTLTHTQGGPLFKEPLDLTFGAWFLNYTTSGIEMESMLWTIATAVRPGGRFVGFMPNYNAPANERRIYPDEYGVQVSKIAEVNEGRWDERSRLKVMMDAKSPFDFETVLLSKLVCKETAKRAGMKGIEWNFAMTPKTTGTECFGTYFYKTCLAP